MKPSTLAIAALIAAAAPVALASTASEREYQRGYNDCSQGRYDQNRHGESYKKGCRAAEDGQPAPAAAGSHGSKAKIPVNFDDLRTASAMAAERGLESRGFVAVDGSQSDSGFSHLIMYNRQTGQCVDLETAEDKVMTINEVTHPKCR
jgi:hypothetical protein